MKYIFKKALSILITLCLILTLLPATVFAVVEPPVLVTAAVVDNGAAVELAFSKDMTDPGGAPAGFSVHDSNNSDKGVTTATLGATSPTKIKLTLTTKIKGGESIYLRYTPGTVAVTAADGGELAKIDSAYYVTNNLPYPSLPNITIPDGEVSVLYTSYTFEAYGGTTPYTYSATGLPAGLTLSTAGILSGTPTAAGTFYFPITVTDVNGAIGSAGYSITITGTTATYICQIGLTPYVTLDVALAKVNNTETITLLQDITDNDGLVINSGKKFTIDLNGYKLAVNNPSGTGLILTGSSDVSFDDSRLGGELNVTGSTQGVFADNGTITVTNVTVNDIQYGIGVHAINNGKITVRGDVNTSGAASYGVQAEDGGVVTVSGDVAVTGNGSCGVSATKGKISVLGNVTASTAAPAAYSVGVVANEGGSVAITGNVTANGAESDGAYAERGGEIIIDGTLTGEKNYINISGSIKYPVDWEAVTTKPNYYTYTYTDPTTSSTSTVWVKFPAGTGTVGWTYRSPSPTSNIIEDVKYLGGRYMAVGYNGTLIVSSDGVSWQTVDVGTDTDSFNGIAYDGKKYVIIGNEDSSGYAGRIFTSDNGATWKETAAIPNHRLYDVAYGGGKFVAVGEAGKILTSTDGENWKVVTVNSMRFSLTSVAYDSVHSLFVAVGFGSTTGEPSGGIMTSSDGVSWTEVYNTGTTSGPTIWDVACANGTLVAVGSTNSWSGYIYTSTDGTTWTSTFLSGRIYSVTNDGTKFMAVGAISWNTAFVATWTDGAAWSEKSYMRPPSAFSAVAFAGTRYVAVGGNGNIYTSDDAGDSWTRQTMGTTDTLFDAAWNGSNTNPLYVAVGNGGTIQTSSDGVMWTLRSSGTTQRLNKVDYLGGLFIAVGAAGTIVTSPDGITWTSQTSGTVMNLEGIAYGAGRIVVVGGSSSGSVVLTSTDGVSWQSVTDSDIYSVNLRAVAFGNGSFLALTEYGSAISSADGVEWVRATSIPGSGKYPTDMIFAESKFVAVGGYGEVYLSANNGTSWTVKDSDLDSYSRSIAYGGGNFIAVGDNGKIMASADGGLTWRIQPSGIMPNPYFSLASDAELIGVAAGDTSFVAVGGNGMVYQSDSLAVSNDPDVNDVNVAKYGLFISDILGSGANSQGSVTQNMSLITAGKNGTSLTWQSSKPDIIPANGIVTRPAFGTGDQVVYLTATITKNSASDTKAFFVVVKESSDPDIQAVTDAKNALNFDTIKGSNTAADNITSNLALSGTGINGTTITWSSNNTTYIANDGTVTRPPESGSDASVTLTATITKGSASDTKTFTLMVKATPAPTPPSDSGNGSGGGGTPSTPITPTYNADVTAGNGNKTTLPVTVDENTGTASVNIGAQKLTSGRTVITVPYIPDVDSYSVDIPVPDLSMPDGQGTLTLETDAGSITVPTNMLTGVSGASGNKAQITIGKGNKDSLPEDVKAIIGDKPFIQLTLSIDGRQTDWSNPGAPVTVSIPYTPTAEELAHLESIVIWYINGSGNVVTIPNSHYNPETVMVTFDTTHFSVYAVAYNKVSFSDVAAGTWYNKAVSFIAAREITTGTGDGKYSPEAKLTRGEFIVLMMRAYGIAPDTNPTDNFRDAGNTYYTGYLAAAKRLGISSGVGNNMYVPGKEITRQEMFTLLYNVLKVIGELPQGDSGKTLSDFSDVGQVDSWAKDAMTLLVKTGTIDGSTGKLTPLSMTTRAEMAQVLYNLLGK